MSKLLPIAIHLPQFHPFAENDAWWGKGFTEWTNVTKAKPLFKNHYQPHLPSDLGFYDMRLEETRVAQAALAKEYGIHGFCYYHYWFNGKRLMERPVNEILASKKPDFPFMLCWANENWTRRWDGMEHEVLIQQNYSQEDDVAHIRYLFSFFRDERYIRVNGKPVFVVYKSKLMPDVRKTTDTWREEARKAGIGELFLCRMEFDYRSLQDPALEGFDAGIEFQPFFTPLEKLEKESLPQKIKRKLITRTPSIYWEHRIFDYKELARKGSQFPPHPYPVFAGITPSWDNAARRKSGATIYVDSDPAYFKQWLQHLAKKPAPSNADKNLVFVNAWNEWAEGNHLEPCQKWGKKYLEAIKEVVQ